MLDRREFGLGVTAAAFTGLSLSGCARLNQIMPGFGSGDMAGDPGYGGLEEDRRPAPLLDLPKDFEYHVISEAGKDIGDQGLVVPGNFDGMGAFRLDDERVILVRNHELSAADGMSGAFVRGVPPGQKAYRSSGGIPYPGGTTTIIYNHKDTVVEREYLSLAGTRRNCSGGVTPWGTWLSCEEVKDHVRDHGWVFEVPADPDELRDPVPLHGLGRFRHEAAAVSATTGIVYLTEDQIDGLFYRFVPDRPNDLTAGGRLQALAFQGDHPNDSRNWGTPTFLKGQEHARPVRWIDIRDPANSGAKPIRKIAAESGAARFAVSEGIYFGVNADGREEIFFCCASGGPRANGQIMRYLPSPREGCHGEERQPGHLELFLESTDPWAFKHCDNITMAPNGDLVICEESYVLIAGRREWSHLRGVTPSGAVYDIARSRTPSELAGVCFAPDGETMFVNVYEPGKTLAITGPWKPRRAGWRVPQAGRFPGRVDPNLVGRCRA